MSRASKIAFGLLGSSCAFAIRYTYGLHKRLYRFEQLLSTMADVMDQEFQKEVDEKFAEIVENYED